MSASAPAIVDVIVPGVTGRMGQLIAGAAHRDRRFRIAGATVRPGAFGAYEDVGPHVGAGHLDVTVKTDLAAALEGAVADRTVVVDFTAPSALGHHLAVCAKRKIPIVVGTTGLGPDERAHLDAAAREIPLLVASNTSLGANLIFALAQATARALPDADVEILELHHRAKKDSPSGTALSIGEAVARGRGVSFDDAKVTARSGIAPRKDGEIGVFGLRGGGVVGEHTAYFFLAGERVELTHRVADRAIFAQGALAAARFLVGQTPGAYTMVDVLGLGGLA